MLLDKVTELVVKSHEIDKLSKEHALTGDWDKFYRFALVVVFTQHFIFGLSEPMDLIELFKRVLIFASISITELFVLALLRILGWDSVDEFRFL